MSTDYNYDEQARTCCIQGQFFPYFVLTITGLVVVPITYSLLKPSKALENTAPKIQSDFKPEHADLIEGQRRKQKKRERKLKRMVFTLGGWLLMAYMVYLMAVTARTAPKIWNPYEILDVSMSAGEKAIKSRYRKLSLTQHPDKVRLDSSKNITEQSVNEHWVEITKAFKALTDEEIRNNYIQYGNPDGKQSMSIGIALPKFLVQAGFGKYVLLVYGLLLGVLLPYLVGKWWYGTQRMTKEKILVSTAGKLFLEYEERMDDGSVISALSCGDEYNEIYKGERIWTGLGKVEGKILADGASTPFVTGMSVKDRDKLKDMDDGVRRKVLGLLWAYLGRVELDDDVLNDEKYEVAPTALTLNEAFTSIALAFGNTTPVLSAYHTAQNITQALPPNSSPLLQLPHFTPSVVAAVEGDAKKHLTVQDFMRIPDEQRKKVTTAAGLSADQYNLALAVASQLPHLQVEKAFFKVMGERFIIPNSLVQFVIKARIIPPGATNVPEVKAADLEDVDPDEGDLDALHGRKKQGAADRPVQPPLAHAPYFARDRSPQWHVFLADGKQGKIAVPPFSFATFDKPFFDANGGPSYSVQTLKMQFQAPPQAGRYTFEMHLVCDSYVGFDARTNVTLVVDEPARAEEIEEEDEISEPDEDTIAGQMNALKTGGLTGAPAPKKTRRKPIEAEESEGSDTEGEVDTQSETDTDTDTDEE
ncbi:Sec63 Brl domain-containing protein [Cryomyces antarcticus]